MNKVLSNALLPFTLFGAILAWAYAISSSIILFCTALIIRVFTFPFDRQGRLLHRFSCLWAYHYIQIIPGWRCIIKGRDLVPDRGAFIFAANHQSMADILVIFGVKKHFKWVSKQSVFAVPFIGWNAWLNNYVGIRRGSTGAMETMLQDCGRHLKKGSSVFFFPEGTRSRDGQLRPFKAGPFVLAVNSNTPIVPVVINGTRHILKKKTWILPIWKRVDISVRILPPVHPSMAGNDVETLRQIVRDQIKAQLENGA